VRTRNGMDMKLSFSNWREMSGGMSPHCTTHSRRSLPLRAGRFYVCHWERRHGVAWTTVGCCPFSAFVCAGETARGGTSPRPSFGPVTIPQGYTPALAAAHLNLAVIMTDGSLWVAGDASGGQLALGTSGLWCFARSTWVRAEPECNLRHDSLFHGTCTPHSQSRVPTTR